MLSVLTPCFLRLTDFQILPDGINKNTNAPIDTMRETIFSFIAIVFIVYNSQVKVQDMCLQSAEISAQISLKNLYNVYQSIR